MRPVLVLVTFAAWSGLAACTNSEFGSFSGRAGGRTDDGKDVDQAGRGDREGDSDLDATDLGNGGDTDTGTAANPNFEVDEQGMAKQWFVAEGGALVDVAFFVDTSSSMDNEIGQLQRNMGQFLTRFIDRSGALDFQLFLIGGPNDNNIQFPTSVTGDARVEHLVHAVDSHTGLAVARDFFAKTVRGTKIELRAEAVKELVFITDDDAENPDASGFQPVLAGRSDAIHVHGIVGMSGSRCDIAARGDSYIQLAGMAKYQGKILDLCATDWDALLTGLATDIGDRVRVEYELKRRPRDPASIEVSVNGKRLGSDAFEYDADRNAVVLDAAAAPQDGDKVVITFQTK